MKAHHTTVKAASNSSFLVVDAGPETVEEGVQGVGIGFWMVAGRLGEVASRLGNGWKWVVYPSRYWSIDIQILVYLIISEWLSESMVIINQYQSSFPNGIRKMVASMILMISIHGDLNDFNIFQLIMVISMMMDGAMHNMLWMVAKSCTSW